MNIKRGLIRVWVVLSAFWIVGVGITLHPLIEGATDDRRCFHQTLENDGPFDDLIPLHPRVEEACAAARAEVEERHRKYAAADPETRGMEVHTWYEFGDTVSVYLPPPAVDVGRFALFVIGPPALFLLLGALGVWIVRGFRTE